jgi:hypothetical protein
MAREDACVERAPIAEAQAIAEANRAMNALVYAIDVSGLNCRLALRSTCGQFNSYGRQRLEGDLKRTQERSKTVASAIVASVLTA